MSPMNLRKNRTTDHPGLVDLPAKRRSSSAVAADKSKKKEIAAAKAKQKDAQVARVARLEQEIRLAQREAEVVQSSGRAGKRGRGKKSEIPVDGANGTGHLESSSAVMQNPGSALKRKAIADQSFDGYERIESTKVSKKSLLSDAPSSGSSQPASVKPQGLATAGRNPPVINTVIEDFDYQGRDTGTGSSDDEDEADDLKYPGDVAESLVSIKLPVAPASSQDKKKPRPGVRSLPGDIRRPFSDYFIPAVLEEIGCSDSPWKNLGVIKLQHLVDEVYEGLDYSIEPDGIFHKSASGRTMNFRNIIGTAAIINVQAFVKKFKTTDLVEGYVKSGLVYYGEIPFLYRVFDPTTVRSSRERGGYKVTRQGLFQNQAILDTMLVYYGRRGTKQYLPTDSSPGSNPVGMLALVCTAVERALLMHSTGGFIEDKRPFSDKYWGHRTAIYVKLAKDLSTSQWNNFYAALSYAEDVQERLEGYSCPVEHWTDNPDEYFIIGSDPVDEEGGDD